MLVWCALLLPILLGMVGLVIDGGLMMATYREAQNAADAAALVGAYDLLPGQTAANYSTDGQAMVTGSNANNLSNAFVTVNREVGSLRHVLGRRYIRAYSADPSKRSFHPGPGN